MFSIKYLNIKYIYLILLMMVIFAIGVTGCSNSAPPTATPDTDLPLPTETPFIPSPTPEPLAAVVNGENLLLADFEAEAQRYLLALGEEADQVLSEDQREVVLDQMIDEMLLSQAAVENGFELQEAEFDQRLQELEDAVGGVDALDGWMAQYGYSPDGFAASLRRSISAAWQRDEVIAQVAETAEQVHPRQILVRDQELAEDILANLQSGAEFATLALRYDPLTGGDLGWFPRGYILLPEIEEASFALQPGEYSEIVSTSYGYHIVEVIERDEQRKLEPEALKTLQRQKMRDWLIEQREQSQIEIVVP